MAQRDCLSAALSYARRGWAVFPLNGKRPYPGTRGFHDATTDPKQIRRWWSRWPAANVGIACDSQRGPIVVDLDAPNREKGERPGTELLDQLSLPLTRAAASRKGRQHLYFDPMLDGTPIPRTIRLKLNGQKYALDLLGDGGYVVAPPSVHPETGKRYLWLNKNQITPLPRSVARLLRAQPTYKSAEPLPEVIGEGERDTLLTSLAGSMRRRGASAEAILAALREENATRVDPPLSDKDLRRIAQSIARKAPAGRGENLTDLGNARRFIAQHSESIRAVRSARRPFLVWDGTRWVPDETGEVDRMAKNTVRSLYAEASQLANVDEQETMLKFAAKSEQSPRIRAILELAATEPEIAFTADAFDADPWLLNLENGTLDLKAGKLLPHQKEHLITKLAPVEYDPTAEAPRWEQFLREVTNDDTDLVDFLQRAVGYTLTGDTREHCLFFCYGQGRNGKSTFLEVLRELLGDYAQQSDFTTFLSRRSEGPRNDVARMRGARLVTASEAQEDRGWDGAVVKQLTGGDTIMARRLYEEFFEFTPEYKLWLAANHKPMVREQSEGFWSRIRLIPFTVTFAPEQRDKKLDQRLRAELPGILNWAIRGTMKWRKEGLHEPIAVKRATRAYRDENDILGEFIGARCALDAESWTSTPELYQAFQDWWAETRGPRIPPFSPAWFGRALGERQELTTVKRRQTRGWRGIAVRKEMRA